MVKCGEFRIQVKLNWRQFDENTSQLSLPHLSVNTVLAFIMKELRHPLEVALTGTSRQDSNVILSINVLA